MVVVECMTTHGLTPVIASIIIKLFVYGLSACGNGVYVESSAI